ncbi:hypothetical protein GCM10023208_21050 [Erythrobacter westpacificensis]|uniref:TnsA endonuclease N-terminal domain-containing protein n=1 Tax=Erythrobacter westpacificensis TaxID=1055231 RepID=A0ABP9KHV8_9SPHN
MNESEPAIENRGPNSGAYTVTSGKRATRQSGRSKPARPRTKAEELGLYQDAVPTRSWKPGKCWVARDGIFPKCSKCLNTFAPFESSLEAKAHLILSVDTRIRSYVCQPPPLRYWMPNDCGGQDKREYTPDFIALTTDDRLLAIDAKAARFANDPKWTSREPHIRRAYRSDHDVELIVWTEHELCAEPRLSNAQTMYRHRFAPLDPTLDITVFEKLGELRRASRIGELCDVMSTNFNVDASDTFGATMRLALEGLIHLDNTSRYSLETEIRLTEMAE